MSPTQLFALVLESALAEARERNVPVFTFALYHDHEAAAISVCVDTEQRSDKVVRSINAYNMRHFLRAVQAGDLETAALWQANIGRSLSPGDFEWVNLARAPLGEVQVDDQSYVEMVRSVVARQDAIAALAPNPDRLVFACSGPEDEVAYVWSLPSGT
jgi:hypothetical protein